jgi:hypothetical protein
MQIPEIICTDILINYTNIHDNYLISKQVEKERNIKINKAIDIINRCIYKHVLEFRICMDINHYHIPKIYYKKFYPLRERENLMILGLGLHNENFDYQKKLYDEMILNPNRLVNNFNKFIDSMPYDYLMIIGW